MDEKDRTPSNGVREAACRVHICRNVYAEVDSVKLVCSNKSTCFQIEFIHNRRDVRIFYLHDFI